MDFDYLDPTTIRACPLSTEEYHQLVERRGVSPIACTPRGAQSGSTVVAGLLLQRGDADAMICGAVGRYHTHLRHVSRGDGQASAACAALPALSGLILPKGPLFLADTHVSYDPGAEQLAEIALMAADELSPVRHRAQGRAALAFELRHRGHALGAQDARGAGDPRASAAPELEVEGEMHADAALSPSFARRSFPTRA